MPLPRSQRLLRPSLSFAGRAVLGAVLGASLVSVSAAAPRPPAAPIVLTQGVKYRARLSLSFFQCLASKERIRRKLGGGGFADVQVFTSARELPADWPSEFRPKAGHCERYAEGVWARPSTPKNRPPSVEAWWVAAAPPPPSRA